MKKNVGLATCFIDNYGACLQAYALQTAIEKLGHKCEIINYREPVGYEKQKMKKRLLSNPFFVTALSKFSEGYRRAYAKRPKFDAFRNKYLHLGVACDTEKAVYESALRYDAYVCGSDQIWNPLLFSKNNKIYFLDFVEEGKKRIAYAPSIGIEKIPEMYVEEFGQLVSKFDSLSVREKSGGTIIKDILDKDVDVVLDPTLLLNGEEWSQLAHSPKIKKPYIFCYLFGEREYIGTFVEYVRRKLGLPVVCIPFTKREHESDFLKIEKAGPNEFLWLIKNASLVITDSFHATAFSINFNTPFYSLLRNTDNDKNNMNSRIFNILEMTELTERLVTPNVTYPFDISCNMDYSNANGLLQERRTKDFNFLKRALEE